MKARKGPVAAGTPRLESLLQSVKEVLERNYRRNARAKKFSEATIKSGSETVLACIARIWHMGYHIESVHQLNQDHIHALIQNWQANQYSKNTMLNALSKLRILGRWIGKPHLVPVDLSIKIKSQDLQVP